MSPTWFALITQLPTAVNDTVKPEIEQTAAADASTEKLTGKADGEAAAVAVYVAPPTLAAAGTAEVNAIV